MRNARLPVWPRPRRGRLAPDVQHVSAGGQGAGSNAALARRNFIARPSAAGVPVAVGRMTPAIRSTPTATSIRSRFSRKQSVSRARQPPGWLGAGDNGHARRRYEGRRRRLLGQGRNADLILFRARSWSELCLGRAGLGLSSGRPARDRRAARLSRTGFATPLDRRAPRPSSITGTISQPVAADDGCPLCNSAPVTEETCPHRPLPATRRRGADRARDRLAGLQCPLDK